MVGPPPIDSLIPLTGWTVYFKKLFNPDNIPTTTNSNDNDTQPTPLNITPPTPDIEMSHDITMDEVAMALRKLKLNKAHYIDNVSSEMLIYGAPCIMSYLHALLQGCFITDIYPSLWSKACLVPVHKKGSPYNPLNYRGLAIGSPMGKIFDSILLGRLEKFMNTKGLSHCFQGGFKKGVRTGDNVFAFLTLLERQRANNDPLYTCAIDFSKAYDRVDRSILLSKLSAAGVGSHFYELMVKKFGCIEYAIKSNGYIGMDFITSIGLRQGDVMSPLLFNFYIHDLVSHFTDECAPVAMGDLRVSSLQFADDVLVLAGTKVGFQMALAKFEGFCTSIRLCINPAKTRIVVFGHEVGGVPGGEPWRLGGHDIQEMDEFTYLGFLLKTKSTNQNLNNIMEQKALKASFALLKLSKGAPITLAKKRYTQLVAPIHLYGADIWAAYVCPPRNSSRHNDYIK